MDHSIYFVAGMVLGVIFVAVVFALLGKIHRRKGATPLVVTDAEFDERQNLIRYKAYKEAFKVLCFYLVIIGFIKKLTGWAIGDFLTLSFIGIVLAITVFAIICICKDAYLSLRERPKNTMIFLLAVAVVNFIMGMIIFSKFGKASATSFYLDWYYINFICGLMLLIITAVYAVKLFWAKKAGDRE